MKKFYFSILAFAMALFMCVSTAARAQKYEVTVNSAPHNNYLSGGDKFAPADIAEVLGTDTATLHKLISDGGNVYISTTDGKSNVYTGNPNEFWMNAEGVPVGYGKDGCCWYTGISYVEAGVDEETQEPYEAYVYVYAGQFPDYFKKIYTASELKCTMYIVNGEKEVSFDITENVEAGKESTVAKPEQLLSKLEIVKDYTLELPFIVGKSYEGKTYSTTLEGVYEALGVENGEIDDVIADHLLTQVVSTTTENEETTYVLSDSLKNPEAASGGAWFGRYSNYNEGAGEEVALDINAPKAWGAGGNTFYTQTAKLNNGEFSIISGQFPDILKEGDSDYTYLYIATGTKAVRIKVQAKVTAPEAVDPDKMEKVGDVVIPVEATVDNNYLTKDFDMGISAIMEALGCTADDLDNWYAYAQDGSISDNHTQNPGFFFNDEGKIESWGNNAACFITYKDKLADGKFSIGQMQGHFTDITEPKTVKPQVIFQHGQKYYLVTVEYTVKPEAQNPDDFEYTLISREPLYKQMVPEPDGSVVWAYATKTTLDLDYIESKIGTRDFTLYTDKAKTEGEETTLEFNKAYSCDPKPGFWYGDKTYTDKDGQVVVENAGWGSNSFGVTYADGEITWYQYPGQRKAGDAFTANLYLVNAETGNYLQYILNVSYVETEGPSSEFVGTVDSIVTVMPSEINSDGYFAFDIDTKTIAEKFGIDTEALLENVALYTFKTPNSRTALNIDAEVVLNLNGYEYAEGVDTESINVAVSTADGFKVYADLGDLAFEKGSEDMAIIRLSFEANGKRLDVVYTLLSEDSPATGVENIAAGTKAAASFYSANGAKASGVTKGLNIVKYNDGSYKKVFIK